MRQAIRQAGPGQAYEGLVKSTSSGPQWTGKVAKASDDTLFDPLGWGKPQDVFVDSMSDLFHESIPDQWITDVFGVMALAHWHTFYVLTKRAERMYEYLNAGDHGIIQQFSMIQAGGGMGPKGMFKALSIKHRDGVKWEWPLPNVYLGISAENQHELDARWKFLAATPAAVRIISYEPALESVNLTGCFGWECSVCGWRTYNGDEVKVIDNQIYCPHCQRAHPEWINAPYPDWVIVGGESGPHARPFNVQWAYETIAQCGAAGVPVFIKQMGGRPYTPPGDDLKKSGWPRSVVQATPRRAPINPYIAGLLNAAAFRFAHTMPNDPHCYTLKKTWRNEQEFVRVVKYVREHGYRRRYKGRSYVTLNVGRYYYWTMGAPAEETTLINRAMRDASSDGIKLKDRKGSDPAEWPEALRIRQFPSPKSKEALCKE